MGVKQIVSTVFSMVDKISSPLSAIQGKVDKFANAAESALSSIKPKGGLFDSFAGQVAIGNLAAKGIATVTGHIRQNIGSAISYASDIVEVQNVVETVFGHSSAAINDFAKSATDSFGLTELQAKKFSSTVGAIFSGMGISGDPLMEMSKSITGLAGDLASFYNLDLDDAFNKLRSGITGESAPLKKLGIVMSQTNLDAFALSKGIKTSWKSMDQAAQTTLRYQYIMEKTALAQGDYAKPIDSYAVSSRNLTNALQEMQGKMATSLIPTLIKGADFFTDLFRKAGNWADENRPKIEAFLGNAIKFIQKAAKTIAPIALAIAGGIKSIMANLQPVIGRTKDWIAANRELIQTRVQGFVKIISLVIEKMVPLISSVLGIFIRIIPVVATFITSLWGIKTVIGGVSAAIGVISVAVHKVGLAMRIVRLAARSVGAAMRVLHVNPITLIIIAVAALITGFMVLASKVGGVGNAFTVLGQILMKVMLTPLNLVVDCIQALVSLAGTVVPTIGSAFTMAGQTIMKAMLTPINLVIDGIKGLLTVVSKIPGVGGKVEGALSAVATFQDAMNTRLTGSASTLSSDGLSAFVDPARAWAAGGFGQAEREAGMARADGINSRIQAAQEEMNIAHTGSASTLFESGPEAFLDPYKNARAAELERQETARQAAVQEDNSEIVERLDAIARNTGATTSAVEGLGEGNAQGVPGRLNYAQMGQENWWEMARAGL